MQLKLSWLEARGQGEAPRARGVEVLAPCRTPPYLVPGALLTRCLRRVVGEVQHRVLHTFASHVFIIYCLDGFLSPLFSSYRLL